ncbi:hypothetical protein JCM3765_002610 [Sporobolomyces pararoseus]
MGFFSIFTRTKEVDYDTYLSLLQDKITARQSKLQQIRLRERRANALFITYGLALWVLYVALWYFGVVGNRSGCVSFSLLSIRGKSWADVVVSLSSIVFTRRFVRWFYHRREAKEEMIIKSLLKKKQDKVEEIKKKTGYYSTRDLLEKYDEALRKNADARGSAPGTPVKQVGKQDGNLPSSVSTPARLAASASGPSTPQATHARSATTNSPVSLNSVPFPPSPQQQQGLPQSPAQFPGPPQLQQASLPQSRSVMDKLADALLGVSPEEANPYNHKYALICQKCFAHNGLVPKDEFDFVQYRCPHCGHFNPRRKDPLLPGGSSSSEGPAHPHRRVQSLHAPSPLQRSFERFDSPSPEMQERRKGFDEDSEHEEDSEESEENEGVVLKEGGEGSTARNEQQKPRRRGVNTVREQDKMDTED